MLDRIYAICYFHSMYHSVIIMSAITARSGCMQDNNNSVIIVNRRNDSIAQVKEKVLAETGRWTEIYEKDQRKEASGV